MATAPNLTGLANKIAWPTIPNASALGSTSKLNALYANPAGLAQNWQYGLGGQPGFKQITDAGLSNAEINQYLNPAMKALGDWSQFGNAQGQVGQYFAGFGNPAALKGYVDNLSSALGTAAGREFSQNIMPALQAKGVAGGSYGSSRQGIAEGLAAGNAAKSLQEALSQLQYNAAEAERQRGFGAAQEQSSALQNFMNQYTQNQQAKANAQMQGAGLYAQSQLGLQDAYSKMQQILSGEKIAKSQSQMDAAKAMQNSELELIKQGLGKATVQSGLLQNLGSLGLNELQFARDYLMRAAGGLTGAQQDALNKSLQGLGLSGNMFDSLRKIFGA
jgi:hypothetical protein